MESHRIAIYFKERFPIGGVLVISLAFALFGVGMMDEGFVDERGTPLTIAVLVILFASFLLRQRVTDEFKDYRHDTKNFPSRPVQRGVITKNELAILGAIALAIEITIVVILSSPTTYFWYLPVFIYSVLMAREFFIAKWIEKHFTVYFLLHEIIFVLYGVWFVGLSGATFEPAHILWLSAFVLTMTSVEIARKFEFRTDYRGKIVKDTYPAVWGETNTMNIMQLLLLATGILLAYAESSLVIAGVATGTVLSLGLAGVNRTSGIKIIVALHSLIIPVIGIIL